MNVTQFGQFLNTFFLQCTALDKCWIKRQRQIDTACMVRLLLYQVWQAGFVGTTSALAQMASLTQQGISKTVSSSAICLARKRMHWSIMRRLFMCALQYYQHHCRKSLWHGRRIFAIDGTKIILPSNFRSRKYNTNGGTSYLPHALVSVLYQLRAGIPHAVEICRHLNERRAALHHFKALQKGDVLVMDRGFFLRNFWQHV